MCLAFGRLMLLPLPLLQATYPTPDGDTILLFNPAQNDPVTALVLLVPPPLVLPQLGLTAQPTGDDPLDACLHSNIIT